MRRIVLTMMIGCCAATAAAQTFGQMYRTANKYEMPDTVLVTKYVDGTPDTQYKVTGDDKLRIMKAIGFILDVYQAETVQPEDAISVRQPYAYLKNVAPMDSATVYEIAPFFRYPMKPFRMLDDSEADAWAHVGGILINDDKRDSTVVLGTVHRSTKGRDSIFAYPYQYVKALPVKGESTLDEVKVLRKLMHRLARYEVPSIGYGTDWTLDTPGTATVRWHKDGKVKRTATVHSDRLMPQLARYLRTIGIDYTGRGYYRSLVLPGGYRSGMTADDYTREAYNAYPDFIRKDCIEILFPGVVKDKNIRGLLIAVNERPARIYGLADDQIIGWPYFFYKDKDSTRKLNAWLKDNAGRMK